MKTMYLKRTIVSPIFGNATTTIYMVDDKGWYQLYPKRPDWMTSHTDWHIVCNRANCIDNHPGWTVLTKRQAFVEML
jgi:hypothetical protein